MKLIVFGATGGTGQQVVEQALAAGHEVTAVVRRPEAITSRHRCLEVIRGDVFEQTTIARAMVGKDAVISALGARDRGPTTIYSEGAANIMQAMQTAHVRRLIGVTASGLEPGPLMQRLIARPILWMLFKNGYTDMVLMETAVKRSTLDWTIVRPPRLTNGPSTGKYQIAVNKPLSSGWRISRADLADCILRQIENPASYCAVIEIAY
jgi:putative NADH-flavin reductase